MTLMDVAILVFLFQRAWWIQRGPDLSRARSRCNSR
jgi:hypothetical protein